MNGGIGLQADLAIDTGAVGNRFATSERIPQNLGIGQASFDQAHTRQVDERRVALINASGHQNDLVATPNELPRQVSSDETGTAGDGKLHQAILRRTRRRMVI
jgi:hypothetical protein